MGSKRLLYIISIPQTRVFGKVIVKKVIVALSAGVVAGTMSHVFNRPKDDANKELISSTIVDILKISSKEDDIEFLRESVRIIETCVELHKEIS